TSPHNGHRPAAPSTQTERHCSALSLSIPKTHHQSKPEPPHHHQAFALSHDPSLRNSHRGILASTSDALCLWQRSMACLTPKCLTLHTMPRLVSRRSPSLKIDRPQQRKPQSWSTRGPLCSTDTSPSDFVQRPQALSRSRNQDTPNRRPGTAPNRRRQSKAFLSSSSPTLRPQRVALQTALHPNLTPANLPPRQSSVWA
ncbi:hypothetical protein GQ607_012000, partial [Colletotrichum asianum]